MIDPTVQSIAILAVVIAVVLALLALVYVGLSRSRQPRTETLSFIETALGDQWTTVTAAGPAVVTKCLHDDRGWVHELETNFYRRRGDHGDMVRLHYIAPSWPLTDETLRALAEEHLAGEEQGGKSPRQMGLYE